MKGTWALSTCSTTADINVTGRNSIYNCFDANDSEVEKQLTAKSFHQHLAAFY